ncbi:hypothetical protein CRUP_038471 [Coryphaenoides rupestris]|nr:hypothetical protein CRUP_038471 [Coryphaenoides rupestris]
MYSGEEGSTSSSWKYCRPGQPSEGSRRRLCHRHRRVCASRTQVGAALGSSSSRRSRRRRSGEEPPPGTCSGGGGSGSGSVGGKEVQKEEEEEQCAARCLHGGRCDAAAAGGCLWWCWWVVVVEEVVEVLVEVLVVFGLQRHTDNEALQDQGGWPGYWGEGCQDRHRACTMRRAVVLGVLVLLVVVVVVVVVVGPGGGGGFYVIGGLRLSGSPQPPAPEGGMFVCSLQSSVAPWRPPAAPLTARPNTILRLRFNHFATECSWDHLYVYDGDSIYAPLLAAFSGLIVPERYGNESVPEVASVSGYALLHFFSDAAYNLTGFNISYSGLIAEGTVQLAARRRPPGSYAALERADKHAALRGRGLRRPWGIRPEASGCYHSAAT